MDDSPELDEFLRNVGFLEPTWWQKEIAKRLTEAPPRVIVSVPPTFGRGWFLAAWEAAQKSDSEE